jgi:mycofactocin precursor
METRQDWETKSSDPQEEEPRILEEISIEEVFVDGICGVY